MVGISHALLRILSLDFWYQVPASMPLDASHAQPKSIAIIGAGSAGLAMLKTVLDLPAQSAENWEVVLYEDRESVGGVWLPDHHDVLPPNVPKTPLYPLLHTNTPVPSMSYPGFPFPPKTPLYPSHEHIYAYHARYAREHNLLDHIQFNHKIEKAEWVGTPEKGQWELDITDNSAGRTFSKRFDHLVVASGNHHMPRVPVWEGQDEWLASSAPGRVYKRQILHSVYYREPGAYKNRSVVVVGNGASGRDAASQMVPFAREIFMSIRHPGEDQPGAIIKPEISHFTAEGVVFIDGTTADPDVVLLGTGYLLKKPFLEDSGFLRADPSARTNATVLDALVTNTKYIFPLHRHILSLDPRYPPTALAFIGLPTFIANCPSDIAQSLFAANIIANPDILPKREQLLRELSVYEDTVRAKGLDPYVNGHRMLEGKSSDYQDELVDFLTEKGVIPDTGKKFVESWRRDIFSYPYLRRGWKRIESLGEGEAWTDGVKTEAQWAALMRRVNEWQKRWEDENGIPFIWDMDLAG